LTSYDVRLYQCQTGQPYDDGVSRGGALAWGPGNRMLLAGARDLNTQAEVIYALDVALDPAAVRPGQTATLRAAVAGNFVEQADRALDISVDPAAWSVASWDVRFGDGQQATAPGGGRSVAVAHRYLAAGPVRPVVTAHVVGMAEAADFDPATGEPILVRQPFAVDVTNSASGTVAAAPAVGYAAPQIRAAVAPRLDASTVPVGAAGLAQIEAPRGTAVRLFVRPLVDREGYITLDGVASAPGRSRMVAWRLLSGSGDGPPGTITPAGTSGDPATPIVQQWDRPDRITAAGAQPYEVAVSCTMRTTYPDGQQRDFDLDGIVQVSVGYSASTG
ncbi:MAG TPA: hypothetical protein VG245_10675, partial [Candidatus Dormibacteraeota bacterium]|nr:hypothetical protein [Candidatus Dormibacteraeota bacterium]